MSLQRGVYPAAVTPLDDQGKVDHAAVARLLAWFEACGCKGAVLAGTNGEGPSLSAVEKRDLLQNAVPGKLELILGIATPSLDEALWLTKRAAEFGAVAALVMPPFYFRDAEESGIVDWFTQLMDKSPMPVLVYNFPQKTGITLTPEFMNTLARHEMFAGLKDSSGSVENIQSYPQALAQKADAKLFVGNEELLIQALDAGWTGTISGAANVLPQWLAQVIREYDAAQEGGAAKADAHAKFELLLPAIGALRGQKQPALNKALLQKLGILPSARLRPPLTPTPGEAVERIAAELTARLGVRWGDPAANIPNLSSV